MATPSSPPGAVSQAKATLNRADEVAEVLTALQALIIPFIRAADASSSAAQPSRVFATTLTTPTAPRALDKLLAIRFPDQPLGSRGLLTAASSVLEHSVNTWHPGFLDKLYASPSAPGLAADLLLSTLNTNLHVYAVSPALTVVEKNVARELARLVGFPRDHAGGISVQGGSAANTTALVVARNTLYPETKIGGAMAIGRRLAIFTSEHGHYSVAKAAQMLGFGSAAVFTVAVDTQGRMRPEALAEQIEAAKAKGWEAFFLNATAGTTVLGSYDPLEQLATVCRANNIWLHVDASWGGPVIFSERLKWKMKGAEMADTVAINPHKMMGVPVTCSFLLGKDLREFHRANTLPAAYLFHGAEEEEPADVPGGKVDNPDDDAEDEIWDLADLTLQCGRRGDALKLALGWIYYGKEGYAEQIENGFAMADLLASTIDEQPGFELVSQRPPPCLQVCFYWIGTADEQTRLTADEIAARNTRQTRRIAKSLHSKGFMIDYAPGERGSMFRVVVNRETTKTTVERLVQTMERVALDSER